MPTSRISARFADAKASGRGVLVTYLMIGDPDLETSYKAMCALRDNGADIIELGVPFTDPMADGESVQLAGLRSLANNVTLQNVLDVAARFREDDKDTPLILMGYANPVHSMGYEAFADAAHVAGIDGTIIVDLPPEEDAPLRAAYARHDLASIRLATPTTDAARMAVIAEGASGFIYFVAVNGVTGGAAADPKRIGANVAQMAEISGLPICIGFGIRSAEQARSMAAIADGIVVGSAFVDFAKQAHEVGKPDVAIEGMGQLAGALSRAISA